MKNKITFNNGFVTAIALFLEHKDGWQLLKTKINGKEQILTDLRLYGATDHLYDIEIPKILSSKLRIKIIDWRTKCLNLRMEDFKERETTDGLFAEAEDILTKIDKEIFKIKKVVLNYR